MGVETPVEPREAATVILVREQGATPWECFMVRRHVRSEFAPDVYVFPGGKVDEGDRIPLHLTPLCDAHFSNPILFPDDDLPYRIAALRELFEEAGILLAVRDDFSPVEIDTREAEQFDTYRKQVREGSLTVSELTEASGMYLAPHLLLPFSRWITPFHMPRRYDTRFYLARLPTGQVPSHDAVETTHGMWTTPAQALRHHAEGTFPLVFATLKHLERMNRYPSIDALFASVTPRDLAPVTPKAVQRDGETIFLLPGDSDYDDA